MKKTFFLVSNKLKYQQKILNINIKLQIIKLKSHKILQIIKLKSHKIFIENLNYNFILDFSFLLF